MRMAILMRKLAPHWRRGLERRLHKRAIQYWQNALGDGQLVALTDFNPLEIEDDYSHGFLLDLRIPAEPFLSYIGPVLEQEARLTDNKASLSEVPANSLLMRFAGHYPRVLESGRPETAEYDFMTHAGYHVLCRGALLPLSADGATVDHVYGVVSWKSEKAAGRDA